jgi:hypothetical protein
MRLEQVQGEWVIVGEGSEKATVAYAYLDNDHLFYRVGNIRTDVSAEPMRQVVSKQH